MEGSLREVAGNQSVLKATPLFLSLYFFDKTHVKHFSLSDQFEYQFLAFFSFF